MSIKLTVAAAQAAMPALSSLANTQLPIKAAYNVTKMLRKLNEELKDIEAQRVETIKRFGEETQPGFFQVKPECIGEYEEAMKPLMAIEFEIAVNPVKLSELGNIQISAAHLFALDPTFVIDDSEDEKEAVH